MADEEHRGFFGTIGHAIAQFFKQRDISRVLGIIEENPKEVLNTVGKTADAVTETAKSVGATVTGVANIATSDNQTITELHKEMTTGAGSWLTNNIRPIAFGISFIYLILQTFELVPHADWPQFVVMGYMGMRTVDKLGQVFSAAGALKSIFGAKK